MHCASANPAMFSMTNQSELEPGIGLVMCLEMGWKQDSLEMA